MLGSRQLHCLWSFLAPTLLIGPPAPPPPHGPWDSTSRHRTERTGPLVCFVKGVVWYQPRPREAEVPSPSSKSKSAVSCFFLLPRFRFSALVFDCFFACSLLLYLLLIFFAFSFSFLPFCFLAVLLFPFLPVFIIQVYLASFAWFVSLIRRRHMA